VIINCKGKLLLPSLLINAELSCVHRGILCSIDLTDYFREIHTLAYVLHHLFYFSILVSFVEKHMASWILFFCL
jgi:hypothetical protein